MILWPTVIEKNNSGNEVAYDLPSRMLKDRIILLNGQIDDDLSASIVGQLLFLDSQNNDDITIYINSPGGMVTSGMAIFDTFNLIKSNVSTVCVGIAASMASLLLAAGEKGKRFILPNAEVMIHQPLGGAEGQASDIEIVAKHILYTREKMYEIYSNITGKDKEIISKDLDRDNYLNAEAAVKYGLVDKILNKESSDD